MVMEEYKGLIGRALDPAFSAARAGALPNVLEVERFRSVDCEAAKLALSVRNQLRLRPFCREPEPSQTGSK